MEKLIYSSPKKYRILEIKKLLSDNNIPVTSIQLYIYVNMSRLHARGEDEIIDIRERRGELSVPIEDFNEELNDAETFEIYTEEKYADKAMDLIEKYNEENVYKNCIFKSMDYNEASGIQDLLLKKNIPCDDIITNVLDNNDEEYLIYLDPDFREKAEYIIENKDDLFNTEKAGNNIFTKFLKVLIIAAFFFIILYLFDKKYGFIDKLFQGICL